MYSSIESIAPARLDFDLIRKYSIPGPRYTSYPAATQFTTDLASLGLDQAIAADNQPGSGPLSLYFHLPFCETRCWFCGCTTVITRNHGAAGDYLEGLAKEIALTAARIDRRRQVTQMHLGGGTPTFFPAVALRRRGVFVREGDLWPKLAKIRRIVFDKTGTLTLETPVLRHPAALASLSPEARGALFELVADNPHPVSQCLLENLLASGSTPASHALRGTTAKSPAPEPSPARPVISNNLATPNGAGPCPASNVLSDNWAKPGSLGSAHGEIRETVGYGVSLGPWSLGRPGWAGGTPRDCHLLNDTPASDAGGHDVELCRDGEVVARFAFVDAVRANAAADIAALQKDGFALGILSGDRQAKVSALAAELGLPAAGALGDLSPQDKAACITAHDGGSTLMLGDGANDSLAFDQALCRGTPVIHRGVLEQKSDFYYLGRGIDGIRAMFAINAVRVRTQRRILVFSVLYNLIAVGLAVAGHMNPLVAAVMMPINSLLTLLIVTTGMRKAFAAAKC